jgi:formylglycine-generating enzyme required for sulfatase activity
VPELARAEVRVVPLTARAADTTSSDFVRLVGGSFLMGTADAEGFTADGEGPVRTVAISPFAIAPTVVTNVEFAAFVAATGYVTDAERIGWSFVFRQFVPVRLARGVWQAVAGAEWWWPIPGACWHAPEGPGSSTARRADLSGGPCLLARRRLLRLGGRAAADRGGVGGRRAAASSGGGLRGGTG